ncbi:MAG: Peroxiredoxin OsmC, partial [uncultured Rubrobacteraceae bacterium]
AATYSRGRVARYLRRRPRRYEVGKRRLRGRLLLPLAHGGRSGHQPRGAAGCGARRVLFDVVGAQAFGGGAPPGAHPHGSSGALRARRGGVCHRPDRPAHGGRGARRRRRAVPREGRGRQARLRGFQSACGRGDRSGGQTGRARRM